MDKSDCIVGQCVKCLFRPYVYERDGQADPAQCQAQRLPYRALGWRGYQSGGESPAQRVQREIWMQSVTCVRVKTQESVFQVTASAY